jgi:hypothetical protein
LDGHAQAVRAFVKHRAWRELGAHVVGYVRALEVTHGQHGWHPHTHWLVLTDRPLTDGEACDLNDQLFEHWANVVTSRMGPEHRPTAAHGADLRECQAAEYLWKLGLEVTDGAASKRARGNNRTAQEIQVDACGGDPESLALFRRYAAAMRARKMLQCSRELGTLVALCEIAQEAARDRETELVAALDNATWKAVQRAAPDADALLLDIVESSGPVGVFAFIEALLGRVAAGNARGLTHVLHLERRRPP